MQILHENFEKSENLANFLSFGTIISYPSERLYLSHKGTIFSQISHFSQCIFPKPASNAGLIDKGQLPSTGVGGSV